MGAAGATGRGEEVIKTCGSFAVVEAMRRGVSPQDACIEALRNIIRWTRANPDFDVKFVALRRDGVAGCAAITGGSSRPFEAALQTRTGLTVLQAAKV